MSNTGGTSGMVEQLPEEEQQQQQHHQHHQHHQRQQVVAGPTTPGFGGNSWPAGEGSVIANSNQGPGIQSQSGPGLLLQQHQIWQQWRRNLNRRRRQAIDQGGRPEPLDAGPAADEPHQAAQSFSSTATTSNASRPNISRLHHQLPSAEQSNSTLLDANKRQQTTGGPPLASQVQGNEHQTEKLESRGQISARSFQVANHFPSSPTGDEHNLQAAQIQYTSREDRRRNQATGASSAPLARLQTSSERVASNGWTTLSPTNRALANHRQPLIHTDQVSASTRPLYIHPPNPAVGSRRFGTLSAIMTPTKPINNSTINGHKHDQPLAAESSQQHPVIQSDFSNETPGAPSSNPIAANGSLGGERNDYVARLELINLEIGSSDATLTWNLGLFPATDESFESNDDARPAASISKSIRKRRHRRDIIEVTPGLVRAPEASSRLRISGASTYAKSRTRLSDYELVEDDLHREASVPLRPRNVNFDDDDEDDDDDDDKKGGRGNNTDDESSSKKKKHDQDESDEENKPKRKNHPPSGGLNKFSSSTSRPLKLITTSDPMDLLRTNVTSTPATRLRHNNTGSTLAPVASSSINNVVLVKPLPADSNQRQRRPPARKQNQVINIQPDDQDFARLPSSIDKEHNLNASGSSTTQAMATARPVGKLSTTSSTTTLGPTGSLRAKSSTTTTTFRPTGSLKTTSSTTTTTTTTTSTTTRPTGSLRTTSSAAVARPVGSLRTTSSTKTTSHPTDKSEPGAHPESEEHLFRLPSVTLNRIPAASSTTVSTITTGDCNSRINQAATAVGSHKNHSADSTCDQSVQLQQNLRPSLQGGNQKFLEPSSASISKQVTRGGKSLVDAKISTVAPHLNTDYLEQNNAKQKPTNLTNLEPTHVIDDSSTTTTEATTTTTTTEATTTTITTAPKTTTTTETTTTSIQAHINSAHNPEPPTTTTTEETTTTTGTTSDTIIDLAPHIEFPTATTRAAIETIAVKEAIGDEPHGHKTATKLIPPPTTPMPHHAKFATRSANIEAAEMVHPTVDSLDTTIAPSDATRSIVSAPTLSTPLPRVATTTTPSSPMVIAQKNRLITSGSLQRGANFSQSPSNHQDHHGAAAAASSQSTGSPVSPDSPNLPATGHNHKQKQQQQHQNPGISSKWLVRLRRFGSNEIDIVKVVVNNLRPRKQQPLKRETGSHTNDSLLDHDDSNAGHLHPDANHGVVGRPTNGANEVPELQTNGDGWRSISFKDLEPSSAYELCVESASPNQQIEDKFRILNANHFLKCHDTSDVELQQQLPEAERRQQDQAPLTLTNGKQNGGKLKSLCREFFTLPATSAHQSSESKIQIGLLNQHENFDKSQQDILVDGDNKLNPKRPANESEQDYAGTLGLLQPRRPKSLATSSFNGPFEGSEHNPALKSRMEVLQIDDMQATTRSGINDGAAFGGRRFEMSASHWTGRNQPANQIDSNDSQWIHQVRASRPYEYLSASSIVPIVGCIFALVFLATLANIILNLTQFGSRNNSTATLKRRLERQRRQNRHGHGGGSSPTIGPMAAQTALGAPRSLPFGGGHSASSSYNGSSSSTERSASSQTRIVIVGGGGGKQQQQQRLASTNEQPYASFAPSYFDTPPLSVAKTPPNTMAINGPIADQGKRSRHYRNAQHLSSPTNSSSKSHSNGRPGSSSTAAGSAYLLAETARFPLGPSFEGDERHNADMVGLARRNYDQFISSIYNAEIANELSNAELHSSRTVGRFQNNKTNAYSASNRSLPNESSSDNCNIVDDPAASGCHSNQCDNQRISEASKKQPRIRYDKVNPIYNMDGIQFVGSRTLGQQMGRNHQVGGVKLTSFGCNSNGINRASSSTNNSSNSSQQNCNQLNDGPLSERTCSECGIEEMNEQSGQTLDIIQRLHGVMEEEVDQFRDDHSDGRDRPHQCCWNSSDDSNSDCNRHESNSTFKCCLDKQKQRLQAQQQQLERVLSKNGSLVPQPYINPVAATGDLLESETTSSLNLNQQAARDSLLHISERSNELTNETVVDEIQQQPRIIMFGDSQDNTSESHSGESENSPRPLQTMASSPIPPPPPPPLTPAESPQMDNPSSGFQDEDDDKRMVAPGLSVRNGTADVKDTTSVSAKTLVSIRAAASVGSMGRLGDDDGGSTRINKSDFDQRRNELASKLNLKPAESQ